ncbi:hypothetical protein L1887_59479 [Cichorium endivia]|nr:hypothetical protein L1887_59479 [Cichorium endivia]
MRCALVKTERDVECIGVAEQRRVHDARRLVRELAHVAAEEDGMAGFDAAHHGVAHDVDGGVDVADGCALPDVAEPLDGDQLVRWMARLVPEAEVALAQLKLVELEHFGCLVADHVARGKEPAASGALLVHHRFHLRHLGESCRLRGERRVLPLGQRRKRDARACLRRGSRRGRGGVASERLGAGMRARRSAAWWFTMLDECADARDESSDTVWSADHRGASSGDGDNEMADAGGPLLYKYLLADTVWGSASHSPAMKR